MSEGEAKYRKVMIVDDTQMDRYVAERNIKKCFFASEVIAKDSARSALEYLREHHANPDELPRFIFLDIRMPEIDGFGFLEEFALLPESVKSTCVIVMLSSSLDPYDHERASQNCFVNRFLNKPLSREQLENIS